MPYRCSNFKVATYDVSGKPYNVSLDTGAMELCHPSTVPFVINPSPPNDIAYTTFCKIQSIFSKAATEESTGSMAML